MNVYRKELGDKLIFSDEELHDHEGLQARHPVFARALVIQELLSCYIDFPSELEEVLESIVDHLDDASRRARLSGSDARVFGEAQYIKNHEAYASKVTGTIGVGDDAMEELSNVTDEQDPKNTVPYTEVPGQFIGFGFNITLPSDYDDYEIDDDLDDVLCTAELVYQVQTDYVKTSLGTLAVYATGVVGKTELLFEQDAKQEADVALSAAASLQSEKSNVQINKTIDEIKTIVDGADVNVPRVYRSVADKIHAVVNSPNANISDTMVTAILDYLKVGFDLDKCITATSNTIFEKDGVSGDYRNTVNDDNVSEQYLNGADFVCMPAISLSGASEDKREVYLATAGYDTNGEHVTAYIPLSCLLDLEPRVNY